MNASGTITMSMTEPDRLKVVQAVCERRLKPGQAADRLALSVRQVERLVQRYQAAGVAGPVSGKRGRPGNQGQRCWICSTAPMEMHPKCSNGLRRRRPFRRAWNCRIA